MPVSKSKLLYHHINKSKTCQVNPPITNSLTSPQICTCLSLKVGLDQCVELMWTHTYCLPSQLCFSFRIREVLHNLGNKEEVQEYKNYESNKELYDTVQKYTKGKSFSGWKSNVSKDFFTKCKRCVFPTLPNCLVQLRVCLDY